MIQRLIGIGSAGDGLQQVRQNLGQLASFMRLPGHRLKIPIGLLGIS
jgi:hypothetical protein